MSPFLFLVLLCVIILSLGDLSLKMPCDLLLLLLPNQQNLFSVGVQQFLYFGKII